MQTIDRKNRTTATSTNRLPIPPPTPPTYPHTSQPPTQPSPHPTTPPQPPQTLHNPHRNPRPQTNPQPRTRPPIRKKDTAPHHMTPLFPRQFLQRSHIRITRKLKPMNKPTLRRNITSAYRKVGLNQ